MKLWKKFWQFNKKENESLITILRISDFLGIWQEGRGPLLTIVYVLGLLFSIIYILDIYLFLIVNFSFDAFIIFVQYSAFQMSPMKAFTFIVDRQKWTALIALVSLLERESICDAQAEHVAIVLKYRKYCRLIVKVFWTNYIVIDIIYFTFFWKFNVFNLDEEYLEPNRIIHYNIFNIVLPFDGLTRQGRIIAALLQTLFLQVSAAHVLCWDSMILAMIIFLVGQLRSLRVRCERALDDPSEDMCIQNLIKCHQQYERISECHKIFNSLISPVTFLYYLMIQVNYGVSIVLLVSNQKDSTLIYTSVIMIFSLGFQLFVHFSLGNELIIASEDLSYAVFKSDWVFQTSRVRRTAFMLSIGLRRRIALTAGPFREMSLSTFIGILKTSYSFYTLLRKRSN